MIAGAMRVLVIFLMALAISASGQNATVPNPAPPQGESTQPQQTSSEQAIEPQSVQFKKLVAFLTVKCQDGTQFREIRGTAFFVSVQEKGHDENRGFVYLVTNRHMITPEFEGRKATVLGMSLRLNLKNPVGPLQSSDAELHISEAWHWFLPQDEAVDLAVLPIAPDPKLYDYTVIPLSLFATKDVIQSERIAEGDSVLFTGFFYQFPGQRKMEPIVRQGILAMMPDEPLETTLGKRGQLYLADVHVFGGNSGAPMFVNIGGFRNGSLIAGAGYLLLGVVSGYFYETEKFSLQVATTVIGVGAANSGISIVVPAEALKVLLEAPELKQQRIAAMSHTNTK